ncbi:MAG: hypothetical protein WBD28_00890 [Candidatus Zixiibacteriota bacterium]
MKSATIVFLGLLILIFAFSTLTYAGVPQMINYQGKLTTPAGALIDDTLSIVFTIYDAATGGTALWTETQATVVVEKGIFSVLLGSVNLIPDTVFTGDVGYLGVKVEADPEMTPRKEMVSVAYAYLTGSDGDWTVYGDSVYRLSGNVGIGQIPPEDVKLYVKTDPPPGDWMYGVYAEAGMGVKGVSNAISGTGISGEGGHCGVKGLGYIGILGEGLYGGWFEGNGYFSGKLGIGTNSPIAGSKLHVQHDNLYAGYFTSNYLSDNTHVIHSEFTGSGEHDAKAVYGKSTPADYYGYGGYFEAGFMGVAGRVYPTGSYGYFGVYGLVFGGSGYNYGLYGRALGSGTNYGVYGLASGGTTNWAGYFDGNAMVTGTLTKGGGSFQIDHPLDPENKYLYHSFVESPDMKNVYDGVVTLDAGGEATVKLPDYFEALNRDFRYQLTCIGGFAHVFIAQEISTNQFTIAGGEPGMKVSWQVTGIRHDKFAEANRIQVEVDKPVDERGKYLHPEAYKLGEEYDIHYEQHKQMKERETKEMK